MQGSVVDGDGCAIADYCPCDAGWTNHGVYVSCVTQAVNDFRQAGLVAPQEAGAVVSATARSDCP